eukprot:TRINITY_DN2334_c0_g1_i3.p1 TRINITY_DN2334_c0_g1~~TRINITY_DN2334_c0_g1_i3.p1  ORF type:complete len:832 (+),score=267.34 TRINITY_DN2334_c0_g1_i3:105-2498(+)
MSIGENISMGCNRYIYDEEIVWASAMANAHEFIMQQPYGYYTYVGEKGVKLSGGQKQRIAIARALVRYPKILLLDEATSALDTESEKIVQDALEKARKGRTTIIVAHRLSTIKDADNIMVMNKGQIVEQGKHDQLMENKGLYYTLVKNQEMEHQKKENKDTLINTIFGATPAIDSPLSEKFEKEKESKAIKEREMQFVDMYMAKKIQQQEEQQQTIQQQLELQQHQQSFLTPQPIIAPQPTPVGFSQLGIPETQNNQPSMSNSDKTSNFTRLDSMEDDLDEDKFIVSRFNPILRAFKYIKPDWIYYSVALFSSIVNGGVWPFFGIIFARLTTLLLSIGYGTDDEKAQTQNDVVFWSGMFFVIATVIGASQFLSMGCHFLVGGRMTRTARKITLKSIMRQNIGFFDDRSNGTGILLNKLGLDASLIDAATGSRLGTSLQIIACLVCGIIVALKGSWVMSVALSLCIPFLFFSEFFNVRLNVGAQTKLQKAYETSGFIAAEAIGSIRTVTMLARELYFMNRFSYVIEDAHQKTIKTYLAAGLARAFSGFFQYGASALGMFLTGEIVKRNLGTFKGAVQAQQALMFAIITVTQISAGMPDFGKARNAVKSFFKLVDRIPPIDSEKDEGIKEGELSGNISFRDIEFHYPTRKDVTVLSGFNLQIKAGQTVALVGHSGCGKSTVIGMLERFYDPKNGQVLIDGVDIRNYNIKWLRSQIGLVSQEPSLFSFSIKENIALGMVGREATMEEIIEAAKKANAHNFIKELPLQYDSLAGEKGTQLSGGEKQVTNFLFCFLLLMISF